jgi:hypothetical protein
MMEQETEKSELLKLVELIENAGHRIGRTYSTKELFHDGSGYHETEAFRLTVYPGRRGGQPEEGS